jgi:signal transduction histidine kinase
VTVAPAPTAWTSPTGSHCSNTTGHRCSGPVRLSTRTDVAGALREVLESRARIMAAADDERRRIERDLHDGAQQRLVALRIRIELAAEL